MYGMLDDNIYMDLILICYSGTSSGTSSASKISRTLPSSFLGKRNSASKKRVEKITTYNRDVICLPMTYRSSSKSSIKIPRDRCELSRSGLIGKITLLSSMNQEEIFAEMRSVFRVPMGESEKFSFDILQPAGGKCKELTVPALSSSYQWTASSIVPKNAKLPLYILAKEPLIKVIKVAVWILCSQVLAYL